MTFWNAIVCVWMRYLDVYRKNLVYSLVTTFVEPLLYLGSFGFGVGSLVHALTTEGVAVSYRQFVFAGIIGQTVLFQAFFEAAYGGFVRMYYQKVFQAIAVTPITIEEVLWAELLWNASKATFAASAVVLLGCLSGDFHWGGVLLVVPTIFVGSLVFASFGLLVAARSRSIDEIAFPQFLLVFPMFLFCGVFFPLENLPGWAQGITWFLPLTPLLAMIRTFVLGLPWHPQALAFLLLWLIILIPWSRRAMLNRLIK